MTARPENFRYPAGFALVREGSLRIAPALSLPGLVTELGGDWERMLAESGVDPNLFNHPENTIPFADLGRLLELCVASTGCPHLGLLAGGRHGIDALGVVGGLASYAPDLGSALRSLILLLHLHDRGAIPALWVSGDRAVFAYTIYQADVPGTLQIYDGALAIAHNLMNDLLGPDWRANEVRLYRERPSDIDPYRSRFRTTLTFGAEHSALVFPALLLDRPLAGADPRIYSQLTRAIEEHEAQGGGDLAGHIKRVLRRLLVGGACQNDTSVSQVSSLFGVHRRTLNRRLRERGTSFRDLIDITRYEMARQLLRDTAMPVSQIGAALDYAETAAFVRAFRRWSGTTPAAWRSDRQRV